MNYGAIILCGGKSSRMGHDKASLPFGPELMLQRVIHLLSHVVEPRRMVVVAAPAQVLPELPMDVIVTRDRQHERGPLEGLAAGLTGLPPDITAAYVTACDVPLLVPEFVAHMFDLLEDFEIVVPAEGDQVHPLSAVCRTTVLSHVQRLLQADQLRYRLLLVEAKTRYVPVDELRTFDPDLRTLVNLNHPLEYQKALRLAGFPTSDSFIATPDKRSASN